jgi:hypothetical protein
MAIGTALPLLLGIEHLDGNERECKGGVSRDACLGHRRVVPGIAALPGASDGHGALPLCDADALAHYC